MSARASAYGYLRGIWNALFSAWEGMSVTLSHMVRRPMTIQYPDRVDKPVEEQLPERYRGILEAQPELCTGCLACARECPIGCIAVDVQADPATKQRLLRRFSIDAGKCMYCGLCAEACPTGVIRHTRHFAASNVDALNLVIDFVDEPRPVHRIKKGEPAPASPPRGAILAGRLARIRWDRARALVGPDPRPVPVAVKLAVEDRDRPAGETEALAEPMLPAQKARPAGRPQIARARAAAPAAAGEEGKHDA